MTKFRIDPAGVELEVEEQQSLLDAALAAGHFMNHSCRKGECGTCAHKLVEGTVAYPDGVELAEVPEGQCLTCVARPTTDVTVEAPEVTGEPGYAVVQAPARVLEVERPNSDVTVVTLQVPANKPFRFKAGQYAEVILRDGARRSYSMANAPNEEGLLEWHIRAVPGGKFSNHAYQKLKPKALLRIEGPFGSFYLRESDARPIFLASGTGFAPIAAILKAHGEEIARRGGIVYWGGRKLEDLYAYEGQEAWRRQFPDIPLVPVLSEPDADWQGRTGLVHAAVLEDYPDMSTDEIYACGNPLMVDAAREDFVARAGLDPERFYSDAFIITPPAESLAAQS